MSNLITIEGGDFTGKTSVVVPALGAILQTAGHDVLLSREPGGTPAAEEIRRKIFARLEEGASSDELAMLFNEARRIHLNDVIQPFFNQHENGIAVLDRYCDSTLVYQGMESGVPIADLLRHHEEYAGNVFPDLTVVLYFNTPDIGPIIRQRRLAEKKADGRDSTVWDNSSVEAHLERQHNYLALPKIYAEFGIARNFAFVDSSQHPYDTIRGTVEAVQSVVPEKGDLLETFEHLKEMGHWAHLDEVWQMQQRLRSESGLWNNPGARR